MPTADGASLPLEEGSSSRLPFLPEIEDLTPSLFSVGEGTQLRLPILPEFTFPALPVAVFAGIPISIRVLAVRKAGLWARLPILPQIRKGCGGGCRFCRNARSGGAVAVFAAIS